MRKLIYFTAAVLFVAVCIACFAGCRPDIDKRVTETSRYEASETLKPATLIKLGNHTYYPDYIFERRNIIANPEEYIIERTG